MALHQVTAPHHPHSARLDSVGLDEKQEVVALRACASDLVQFGQRGTTARRSL
jgi:hypothetical protein